MGYFTLLTLLSVMLQGCQGSSCSGVAWNVSWAPKPRNDLLCGQADVNPAAAEPEKTDECSACRSCAIWEGTEINLFIEYMSVLGKSLVLTDKAREGNQDEVYKVEKTNSEMSEIPSNLCNWDEDTFISEKYRRQFNALRTFWDKIVKIDFRNNKILKLPNLNCLVRLDDLNLQNNRLKHISNNSFSDLSYLRSIDFSGNMIRTIDPNTLATPRLNIFWADFSHNQLDKLDVSNMMSLFPFCSINYDSNKITDLVNKNDYILNISNTYGPGFVHIRNNEIETFPDFTELLHLEDIYQMGKLLNAGFDFRGNPLYCDCYLASLMRQSKNFIQLIWLDHTNVTCVAPEEFKGIFVGDIDPARFICEEKPSPACPLPYCTCIDKPNAETLYINCSYQGGRHLDYLPPIEVSKLSDLISLNFSGQQLTNITNLTRLANITMLDISHNDVSEISTDVARALENATWVDLSNNFKLHEFPKAFLQYRNVCSTNMRNLEIYCNCESAWIESWLHSKSCINEENIFRCILQNSGKINALAFKPDDLKCIPKTQYTNEWIISGIVAFLIITGMSIYTFRYEILILIVRTKQRLKLSKVTKFEYDVFLSFNNDDEDVQHWIKLFEEHLAKAGYKVFLPMRDIQFGEERDIEILSNINKSRNFVIIFTDNYFAQTEPGIRSWTENEWKYGWHNFLRDRSKNIVLINLDHVSSFDIDHSKIKAFLRVGCVVDFKNHDRKIMKQIFKILGKPYSFLAQNANAMENKPRFQPYNLMGHFKVMPDENKEPGDIEEQDILVEKDIEHTSSDTDLTIIHGNFKKQSKVEQETEEVAPPFVRARQKDNKIKKFQRKKVCLACRHDKTELKKTPHIPLFKSKEPAKTVPSLNPTSIQGHKMDNQLKRNHQNTQAEDQVQCNMNKHAKKDERTDELLTNKRLRTSLSIISPSPYEKMTKEWVDRQSVKSCDISVNSDKDSECAISEVSHSSINVGFGSSSGMTDISV